MSTSDPLQQVTVSADQLVEDLMDDSIVFKDSSDNATGTDVTHLFVASRTDMAGVNALAE